MKFTNAQVCAENNARHLDEAPRPMRTGQKRTK